MPAPLADNSEPFEGLPELQAYQCDLCELPNRKRLCSYEGMVKHIRKAHSVSAGKNFRLLWMQTWFPSTQGGMGIWWLVNHQKDPIPTIQVPTTPQEAKKHLSRHKRTQVSFPILIPATPLPLSIHTESQFHGTRRKDDSNPFLDRAGWYSIFQQRPDWGALRQITYLPRAKKDPLSPLSLRRKSISLHSDTPSNPLRFGTDEESVLGIIIDAWGEIFNRCQATFDTTPIIYRRWLIARSTQHPHCRPFTWPKNQATVTTYTGLWKRLFCLLFRIYQLDEAVESRVFGVYEQLTHRQQTALESIWNSAWLLWEKQSGQRASTRHSDVDLEYFRLLGTTEEISLQEKLFKFGLSLASQPITTWSVSNQSLISWFCGVLSLNIDHGSPLHPAFIPISQATQSLSAFIWVLRLLALERTLPQYEWRELGYLRREAYADPIAQVCLTQQSLLGAESVTVYGELIYLRSCGRQLRELDIGTCLIFWSHDDSVLTINEKSLRVDDFRHWIYEIIKTGQRQTMHLLKRQSVASLPLLSSLSEAISNREPGVSFLTLPPNRERLDTCTRTFLKATRCYKWPLRTARIYVQQSEELLNTLLLLLHTTAGEPARAPELLSTKICNTDTSPRNLFLYHGIFCIVTRYNKAQSTSDLPCYVIRLLPPCVSTLLYIYLVYVRPLVRFLQSKFQLAAPASHEYLWATCYRPDTDSPPNLEGLLSDEESDTEEPTPQAKATQEQGAASSQANQGFWASRLLTDALRRSSRAQGLSMELTTALYRQVAVGISKKHLRYNSAQKQSTHEEAAIHKLFAWQAGHSVQQEVQSYGLNGDYPTRLQPALFDLFHKVSCTWHDWLGIESVPDLDLYATQPESLCVQTPLLANRASKRQLSLPATSECDTALPPKRQRVGGEKARIQVLVCEIPQAKRLQYQTPLPPTRNGDESDDIGSSYSDESGTEWEDKGS